jgi:hypothetical protein
MIKISHVTVFHSAGANADRPTFYPPSLCTYVLVVSYILHKHTQRTHKEHTANTQMKIGLTKQGILEEQS